MKLKLNHRIVIAAADGAARCLVIKRVSVSHVEVSFYELGIDALEGPLANLPPPKARIALANAGARAMGIS